MTKELRANDFLTFLHKLFSVSKSRAGCKIGCHLALIEPEAPVEVLGATRVSTPASFSLELGILSPVGSLQHFLAPRNLFFFRV